MQNPNIDYDLYKEQKEYLEYCLTKHETGEGKFLVLNHEAGFGKSVTTDSTIINNPSRKYLLVKKYNNEKNESQKRMEDSINWIFGKMEPGTVIVVNADNSSKYEKDDPEMLVNSNVLIISHEKYKLLSTGGRIDLYKKNRHTLIIDEYMDVPIVNLNSKSLHNYRTLYPNELGRNEFNKLEDFFSGILKSSESSKNKIGNMCLVNLPKTHKNKTAKMLEILKDLKDMYYFNISEITSNVEGHKFNDQPITHLTYLQFFAEIESFLTNQSIYSNYQKALYAFRKFDFWTLKNNIILDASGNILKEYNLNEMFKVETQKTIFNYSNTSIHIKDFNSFKYHIEHDFSKIPLESIKKYIEPIKKYIKSTTNDDDEVLIVNYKSHDKYFEEFKDLVYFDTNWHGNILGKNTWTSFNKLFVNSIFNLPEPAYILIYSFYSNKTIRKNDLNIKSKGVNGRIFSNKAIEELKQNFILHHLYQTIKRINRRLDKKCDIYIVIDNDNFSNSIKKLLQNVNLDFDYALEFPKTILQEKKEANKKFIAIEKELKRLSIIDPRENEEFTKKNFCKATGLERAKLKQELAINKTNRELCERYFVDLKKTFLNKSIKLICFKNQKTTQ